MSYFLGANGVEHNRVGIPASMRITKKYEYLTHLGYVECLTNSPVENRPKDCQEKMNGISDTSSSQPTLVAVEVKPQFLESQLPPSVRRKKFGAM